MSLIVLRSLTFFELAFFPFSHSVDSNSIVVKSHNMYRSFRIYEESNELSEHELCNPDSHSEASADALLRATGRRVVLERDGRGVGMSREVDVDEGTEWEEHLVAESIRNVLQASMRSRLFCVLSHC